MTAGVSEMTQRNDDAKKDLGATGPIKDAGKGKEQASATKEG